MDEIAHRHRDGAGHHGAPGLRRSAAVAHGLLILVAAAAPACRSDPAPARPAVTDASGTVTAEGSAPLAILPRRVAVVTGVVIIPLAHDGLTAPRAAEVRDRAGRSIPAAVYRVGVRPDAAAPPGPGRWMSRPGTWLSVAPDRAGELPIGLWVLRLDARGVEAGTEMRLNGETLPLDWLSPDEAAGRQVLLDAAQAQPLAREQADALAAMIEPMLASPLERWRAEALLGASLRAGAAPARAEASPRGVVRVRRPADGVVDELAEQTRRRWLAGLARLAEVDLALAEQVAARMVGLVRFDLADEVMAEADRAVVAPVWPAVEGGAVTVADDLLDPRADRSRLVAAARALLAQLPAAVAWTIDDAGAAREVGPSTRRAVVGLANLSAGPVTFWAAPDQPAGRDRAGLRRIEPGQALAEGVALTPRADQAAATVRARVGAVELAAAVQGAGTPAAPPGFRVGPLAADWTMSAWLTGAAQADRACTALLYRPQPSGAGSGPWMLFIEARTAPGQDPASDRVRLWFGPTGRARAVLTVYADGRVTSDQDATAAGGPAIEAARDAAGWSAWVPVPASAVEPGGWLRLGVERIDPAGHRAAWPRPMLPWQREPGRALIDLNAWGE